MKNEKKNFFLLYVKIVKVLSNKTFIQLEWIIRKISWHPYVFVGRKKPISLLLDDEPWFELCGIVCVYKYNNERNYFKIRLKKKKV